MKSLIIGMGEVGTSMARVLGAVHEVHCKDIENSPIPKVEFLHICMRYGENFEKEVRRYWKKSEARYLDICTTVPPGTTERLSPEAVHSTTRGLHPSLVESLRTFTKHIGGGRAREVAEYYQAAGVKTKVHAKAKTTELAHILSNAVYGVNLLFADEMNKICRHYGVDYTQAVIAYNESCNAGYLALDQPSKFRMVLSPPQGKIGGHCVRQGAGLIPQDARTPLLEMLANS